MVGLEAKILLLFRKGAKNKHQKKINCACPKSIKIKAA